MKKKNLYKLVKQSLKEVLQEQRRDRRLRPDDIRRDRRLNPSTGRPFRPGDSFVDPITGRITILKPDDIDIELGIPKALVGAPTQGTTLADPIKTKDLLSKIK